ncbi:MAG: TRAP transporter small permease [Chloroflexi bacterium]|nr:TRAP transporter small permease [Chloroflexota bacterium]
MAARARIESLIKAYTRFNRWLMIVPMVTLLAIMLIDGLNIITIRFFGIRATPVQKEIIEELLIVMGYMALAYILLAPGTGHIKTEMIQKRLPEGMRKAANILIGFVSLFVSGYVVYASTTGLIFTLVYRSAKEGMVMIPLAPFYLVIPLSFLLFFIGSLLLLIRDIAMFGEPGLKHEGETAVPAKTIT